MAGESTYAGIASLVANIYDLAVLTAQEGNAISPFVTVFNETGSAPRVFGAYSGGTFASVAEDADMSPQAFNASVSLPCPSIICSVKAAFCALISFSSSSADMVLCSHRLPVNY